MSCVSVGSSGQVPGAMSGPQAAKPAGLSWEDLVNDTADRLPPACVQPLIDACNLRRLLPDLGWVVETEAYLGLWATAVEVVGLGLWTMLLGMQLLAPACHCREQLSLPSSSRRGLVELGEGTSPHGGGPDSICCEPTSQLFRHLSSGPRCSLECALFTGM